jgi:hypothetical protein
VSAVSTMLEWPSISCTVRMSTPAANRRGSAVPKVMKPHRRQARPGRECLEDAGQPVGGHRVAVQAGEHVPAGLVAGPEAGGLGELPALVRAQRRDRGVLQGDHPDAVRGLGRADGQLPVVLLQLLADHRHLAVQVHVAPAQPGRYAPSAGWP